MPARHAWILLLVFLVSIVVRLPQLGRPLSKNHEFATADVLNVLSIWNQRGFLECTGCPAMTYPGPCDSEVGPASYSFMQRDGSRYYISHLPLAFWAPLAVFRVLGTEPSPFPLRLFNLALHALTAFFFYRFLSTASGARSNPLTADVPLIGAALYLVMPAPLWYHGNVYMSDMAVQLPWAWVLATGTKVLMAPAARLKRCGWFVLAIATCALTEWIGLFVAGTFAAWAIARARVSGDRSWYLLAGAIMAVALIVVCAAVWLYADIAGWPALWRYYTYRWEDRSTFGEGQGRPLLSELAIVPFNLLIAWGPLLLVLIANLLFVRRSLGSRVFSPGVIMAMALPAVIHLLLFLRYAGHGFAWLKLGFLLCAWSAVVIVRLRARNRWLADALVLMCGMSGMAIHTWVNRPGDGSATGDRYAVHQERGELIARIARPDELICASGIPIEPPIMYYAHRNIRPITEEEGLALVKGGTNGKCNIIWFRFHGAEHDVVRVARGAPEEASTGGR